MAALEQTHKGGVVAIEGPNEVNNYPISFGGLSGQAGAIAYQNALYSAVKAHPVLGDVQVYNLTSYPTLVGRADAFNLHLYAPDGEQPEATIMTGLRDAASAMPGAPTVITETGYYTLPTGGIWGGVDEATQAKLTLNLMLDAVRLGVEETYLYQLLDAYPDPGGTDMERHFGLFDIDNKPKAAAQAIHNLTAVLRDSAVNAAAFPLHDLAYSIAGLPLRARTLVVEKSTGERVLLIWNEPDIWDENSDRATPDTATPITLDLGAIFSRVQVFDPLVGPLAFKAANDVRTLELSLGDHPLAVVLSVPSTPPVTAEPPASSPGVNVVANGSFESGLSGWKVTRGNVDDVVGYWAAAHGTHSLDLNGTSAGTIEQTLSTVAGTRYSVHFELAGNPDQAGLHQVQVSAAGASQTFGFDSTGHGHHSMGWEDETFTFVATGSSTTLAFKSLDSGAYGATLDHVTVAVAAGDWLLT
ncbi:choice-of-anchor C family protein [Micromonospora sp. STR1s_5]|nr:choice-of-anchor C family protein [Micromonospora sp. STR1s_5]